MEPSSWISLFSGILGIILNALLVPIILCYSSQSMQKYRYLMLAYTMSAVLYTTSQAIALPVRDTTILNKDPGKQEILVSQESS